MLTNRILKKKKKLIMYVSEMAPMSVLRRCEDEIKKKTKRIKNEKKK